MRPLIATAALTLAAASWCAPAQDSRLPDIGSSAGAVLGPAQQKEYGQLMLSQLRNYDLILEDPLIDGWLRGLGNKLGAASEKPEQDFTFFMMRDRQVNAFATVGGYIGLNAGLVLMAESEDEVAAVLSHEIAHVTQSHLLRGVERAQRDSIPMLLAMLGAIAVAGQSSGGSTMNGAMAAVAGVQGLAAQRQINFTRSNEAEADRFGIRTLDRSGYDPAAMAEMFERMQTMARVNQGGEKYRTPDYLQSHPVTTLRISEAKEQAARLDRQHGRTRASTSVTTPEGKQEIRVERIDAGQPALQSDDAWNTRNPLLPASLQLVGSVSRADPVQFGWVRERLRVLSANTPTAAIGEYQRMQASGPLEDSRRYGLAFAHLLAGHGAAAAKELAPLVETHPDDPWIVLAMAQSEARAGDSRAADKRFESLLARMPRNRAVALTYAGVLAERNNAAAGRRAQEILRPLLGASSEDPLFQTTFARASEIAGEPVRAGEAYAEAAYLNGRPEQALVQLNILKKRDDLDYYQRARIDARIAAITPIVLELRRQGIRDEDLRRR